mgnify:CR=1 FL=1
MPRSCAAELSAAWKASGAGERLARVDAAGIWTIATTAFVLGISVSESLFDGGNGGFSVSDPIAIATLLPAWVPDAVAARPYVLHWMEQTASRLCAPGARLAVRLVWAGDDEVEFRPRRQRYAGPGTQPVPPGHLRVRVPPDRKHAV